jgi:hypothetical protein
MTNPAGVAVEADLDDFNPDDEAPVELTLEQKLSQLNLRQLQQEAKARGLSGAGSTVDLIGRITAYENEGGIIPEEPNLGLKPGVAPAPADLSVAAPGPGNSHLTTTRAAADVVPPSSAAQTTMKALPSKTGYREVTNTWRTEFPIGSRNQIDDATHFQFIEDTHADATKNGFRTKGAPYAGKRVGRSSITVDGRSITTAIYEVSVFSPDHVFVEQE